MCGSKHFEFNFKDYVTPSGPKSLSFQAYEFLKLPFLMINIWFVMYYFPSSFFFLFVMDLNMGIKGEKKKQVNFFFLASQNEQKVRDIQ